MSTIQVLTGFKDTLPAESANWRAVEQTLIEVLDSYGYSQIRLPMVEATELFARGVGEATDIVEKEMFGVVHGSQNTGKDEKDKSFTLRPEGTAGCVRAVIEHNLTRGDTPKLWYMGAMFRYERPQKGRYRQFTQLGVESFGSPLPDADAELIAMTYDMWRELGIDEHLTLELNTLGEADERKAYKDALVAYLTAHFDGLDDDSQRRLATNPLRILDSKDPQTQDILLGAPKLADFLGDESVKHFQDVQNYLDALGIEYVINDKLVRGLDYYNKTVFEWTTDKLGSQATVCGGGRYDGLIGIIKGKIEQSEPAVGFAMGLERLMLLIEAVNPFDEHKEADIFVVAHPDVYVNAVQFARSLRENRPLLRVKMASATSLKSQMKKADKSGASHTVIIGHDEVANGTITVKNMVTGEQRQADWNDEFFDFEKSAWEFFAKWQNQTGLTLPSRFKDFVDFVGEFNEFAQGVEWVYPNDDKTGLQTFSDDDGFTSRIHEFAGANGSGSSYAFWQKDDETELENAPIVVVGDEGGIHLVANNFNEWLNLLSLDSEIYVDLEEAGFAQMSEEEKAEYDWQPSGFADEYKDWLNEQGLAVIDFEQAEQIVQNAQTSLQAEFDAWCNQFFDKE